jgi:hypothetical protein
MRIIALGAACGLEEHPLRGFEERPPPADLRQKREAFASSEALIESLHSRDAPQVAQPRS